MAEGDCTVANNFKEQLALKGIDLDNDTFKVVLLNGWSITPDGASLGYADVSGNEISPSGYVAGGETLANTAVTQDDANNWAKWDADNVTWASLGAATITAAVIYDDTVVGDPIVCAFEIATNSNGGDYTLSFGANGIITLT